MRFCVVDPPQLVSKLADFGHQGHHQVLGVVILKPVAFFHKMTDHLLEITDCRFTVCRVTVCAHLADIPLLRAYGLRTSATSVGRTTCFSSISLASITLFSDRNLLNRNFENRRNAQILTAWTCF